MNNNTCVKFDAYNWNKMIDSFKTLKTVKKDEEKDYVYIRIHDVIVSIYRVNTVDYVTRQCFHFKSSEVHNFDNNIYYCYKLKTSDFLKALSNDIYTSVTVLSDNELCFTGDTDTHITVEKTKDNPETVNSNYIARTSVYFKVLTEDLKEVFKNVTWMLPVLDNIPAKSVKGICFQFEENDTMIRLTGTNGHILLSDTVNITTMNRYSFGNIQEFIIPQKNIKIMQNLIKNHRELKFDVSESHVYISDEGMFVSFELLPEKYPKYKQLQVKDTDSQITLNSKDVMPALKETRERVVSLMPVSAGKFIDFSDVWSDVLRCDGTEVKAIMRGNLYNFYMAAEYLKGLFRQYKQITFQNNKKSYAHNILVTNRPDFIGVVMGCIA